MIAVKKQTSLKKEVNTEFSSQNLYSATDHIIARAAVARLPILLATIVKLRFWQNNSIVEIAAEIGVSTKIVEEGLTRAFRILRQECLMSPHFSRSLHKEVIAARLRSAA